MTLKQALWEIVRDENIIITNQNIDWLLDRAEKRSNDNTDKNKLKCSILERKEKLDKLGEPENKSNEELFKQALVEGLNRRFDKTIEEAKKIEQIEEMAKILCGMKNGCDGCMWNKVYCNERNYAEEIYNAGYRKQSEGEWIGKTDYAGYGYYCSNCNGVFTGENAEWIAKEHKYCPKCGARMRGGEKQ